MAVERNYAVAVSTIGDWLESLAPRFQAMKAKPKQIASCTRDFSRGLGKAEVIAREF